jgi:hypothetical protein
VSTRPFFPRREGPGDEAKPGDKTLWRLRSCRVGSRVVLSIEFVQQRIQDAFMALFTPIHSLAVGFSFARSIIAVARYIRSKLVFVSRWCGHVG